MSLWGLTEVHTVEHLQTELGNLQWPGYTIQIHKGIQVTTYIINQNEKMSDVEPDFLQQHPPPFGRSLRPSQYYCPNTTVSIYQNQQLYTLDITFSLEQVVPNFLLFVHVAKPFIMSPLPFTACTWPASLQTLCA